MAVLATTIGDEVYIYMNGKLIHKRWKTPGYGYTFTDNPTFTYSRDTLMSITDEGTTKKEK